MQITRTVTQQSVVAFTVTDDGGYVLMDTIAYPAKSLPDDRALTAEIERRYAAWRAVMDTPAPAPTRADYQAELVRAERDRVEAEARITKARAAIAACDAVPVKAGDVRADG